MKTTDSAAKIATALQEDREALVALEAERDRMIGLLEAAALETEDLEQRLAEAVSAHELRSNLVEEYKRTATTKNKELDELLKRIAGKVNRLMTRALCKRSHLVLF